MSSGKEDVFHALELHEVFERLKTSVRGLSTREAERRLREYGLNELEEEERTSVLTLVLNQLRSPLIMVLVAAILISLAIGKVVDAAVIGVFIADELRKLARVRWEKPTNIFKPGNA
ncbi:MAG: cation-transporting P-type ATPase [Crenarchaeota archaeon]|nr:cation-transporting P-type ATPase [Thermoproteota archaeon]